MSGAVLLLHPEDNVLVCCRDLVAGETVLVGDVPIRVSESVELGHKIARVRIAAGSAIVKYGMAIGSASTDIAEGNWVHLHNLRSEYISSHTRDSASKD